MKIFPIKPVSTLDRIKNLYRIMLSQKRSIKTDNIKSNVTNITGNNPLKKGRNICDMLSE